MTTPSTIPTSRPISAPPAVTPSAWSSSGASATIRSAMACGYGSFDAASGTSERASSAAPSSQATRMPRPAMRAARFRATNRTRAQGDGPARRRRPCSRATAIALLACRRGLPDVRVERRVHVDVVLDQAELPDDAGDVLVHRGVDLAVLLLGEALREVQALHLGDAHLLELVEVLGGGLAAGSERGLGRDVGGLVLVLEGVVPALEGGTHEPGGRVGVAVLAEPLLVGEQRAVRDRDAVVGRVDDGELVVRDPGQAEDRKSTR